jgi:hypothetical protein
LDGTPGKPLRPSGSRPLGFVGKGPAEGPSAAHAPAPAPAPAPNQTLKTADGRTVPFSLEGKGMGKGVDDAVDFNSGLKKASKTSGLMGERFDAGMSAISKDQVYSRNNLLTLAWALR